MQNLLTLFLVFAPLSLVTIGGGQTAIAEIHRQVVDIHGWLTTEQFLQDFAISRMAPGPGSLLVTLIGWRVAGLWGAIVATLAIFGPAALMMYGFARAWSRWRGARWQRALQAGLQPVAAGMILAAVYVMIVSLEGGWFARAIALAATALLMTTRINPLLVIAGGAALSMGHVALLAGL